MLYLKLGVIFLISYLMGSVSFAIVVSKGLYKQDIRNFGSGNAGMTNVLRTFGKKAATITFAGDFLKGTFSVIMARFMMNSVWPVAVPLSDYPLDYAFWTDMAIYIAVGGALLGHLKPVYFGFKGGKGISVAFGAMMAATPIVTIFAFVVWSIVVILTRYVSLASILAVISYCVFTFVSFWYTGDVSIPNGIAAVIFPMAIIYAHRSNIKRLLSGTENKLGQKK